VEGGDKEARERHKKTGRKRDRERGESGEWFNRAKKLPKKKSRSPSVTAPRRSPIPRKMKILNFEFEF
jgi:hypothetical protein